MSPALPVGLTAAPLEHVVRRTGIVLRLSDLATGAPVQHVVVTAWPAAKPELALSTTAVTAAGVCGFHALPGLGRYEDGSTEVNEWFASPPPLGSVPFVVRVDDTSSTHLPVVREVAAPTAVPLDVALPRSPAAPTPSGFLTVVANLVNEADEPASWAVIELALDSFVTGGVADARGMVVVPVPRAAPPANPGSAAVGPMWQLTVGVRYRPADQVAAPGTRPGDPPTITSLLSQQPALIVDDGQLIGSLTRYLTSGGPVVVASEPGPAAARSVLVVRPTP